MINQPHKSKVFKNHIIRAGITFCSTVLIMIMTWKQACILRNFTSWTNKTDERALARIKLPMSAETGVEQKNTQTMKYDQQGKEGLRGNILSKKDRSTIDVVDKSGSLDAIKLQSNSKSFNRVAFVDSDEHTSDSKEELVVGAILQFLSTSHISCSSITFLKCMTHTQRHRNFVTILPICVPCPTKTTHLVFFTTKLFLY